MNDTEVDCDKTDQEAFSFGLSDEALEAAAGMRAEQATTLIYGSYCLTCGRIGGLDW